MYERITLISPSNEEFLCEIDMSSLDKYELLKLFLKKLEMDSSGNIQDQYELIEEKTDNKDRIFKIKKRKTLQKSTLYSSEKETNIMRAEIKHLRELITERKFSIYKLKKRCIKIKDAKNLLNPLTNVDEIENYNERLAKLEEEINKQKRKLYLEREELFSLVVGEKEKLEQVISKIEKKLPKFSSENINEFFIQLIQFQPLLKYKDSQLSSSLGGNIALTEKQKTSVDEKRIKIKIILGLLPTIEFEKEFVDPDVGMIWKKFWKKVKEIAFKEVS